MREAVAAEVRSVAARKRIPQSVVARTIGMSQQALSRRWTGVIAFEVDVLDAVAQALGVSIGDLLPPTPPPAPGIPGQVVPLPHLDSDQEPTGYGRKSLTECGTPSVAA